MINVLRKAMNKTADPEIGELTNYSLTYGEARFSKFSKFTKF